MASFRHFWDLKKGVWSDVQTIFGHHLQTVDEVRTMKSNRRVLPSGRDSDGPAGG